MQLLQIVGTDLTSHLSQSFESMQRLCDKYNRAIDSIHQLVSGFISARELHVNRKPEQECQRIVFCSVSLDAARSISWMHLV